MRFQPAGLAAIALAIGLAATPSLAQSQGAAPAKAAAKDAGKADDPVVAVVNGSKILKSTLEEFRRSVPQLRQVPLEMVYDQLLDSVINDRLLTAAARKQNVQNDPQVKERVKELENKVIQQAYLTKHVDKQVSDAVLKKRYDELMKDAKPGEEVRARHILVETEEQANEVLADLKKGGSFEEIAKAKSKDTSNAPTGGDLGYFGQQEMVPAFAEAAFAMKPGQVSEKGVQTQFGWHVIKVEDRRQAKPPAFDEVKENIRQEMAEETVMTLIKDLRGKAEVKRFAPDGSALPAEKPAAKPAQ